MVNIAKFLFGGGGDTKRINKKTPEQMQFLQQLMQGGGLQDNPLFQGGSNFLQQLFGGDFEAFEKPLMNKFEQEIAPGIAERFAGMGAGSSSGINQALSQAGENLGAQLGQQRSQLMMQALPQALGFAQQPIQNMLAGLGIDPYEIMQEEGDYGFMGEGLLSYLQGGGNPFAAGANLFSKYGQKAGKK